ncbi:hypothetical protein FPY71_16890 [Aureimonas fodinaquatilis]|uniref:DUF1236 domain-containing protein n=1 Tax=Aureimonas fodinaquatilis TaxID=2565783 RepID=A0A5B0DSK0_9HYPH|nr:hypothetical protein [Aureimonas fodinaquatilis]KAA0968560.1 hypothetical protein FPY71_16890 [Aureimonas fodinaquatilis]
MIRRFGLVAALTFGLAGAATAQSSIYDYALQHPTEDAALTTPPSLGASVPQNVQLHQADDGNGVYGYFFYDGRPVIVDLGTRSIVRIG